MADIQLRFVDGGGWDSRLIEYYTRCWWSHVEAVHEDETFGAMFKGGVRWRTMDDPQYREARRYLYVVIPCTTQQYLSFWEFQCSQEGKPYDWRAILSFSALLCPFVHDRNWRDDSAWFCSELQAAALERAGLIVLPSDISIISYSPRSLYDMVRQIKDATFELTYANHSTATHIYA